MTPRRLWWLVPLALVVVRLHNLAAMPFNHGYDNYGHVLNLKRIVLEGYLPLANDGFSGYHPPLYYLTSGVLWGLLGAPAAGPWKAAQLLSTLSSLGLLGCVWACSRRLVPGSQWFAVTALAALPMELTMAPMILNVPMAALWSGLFLVVLVRAWPRSRPVLWEEIALGLLAGAACLTRMDAVGLVLVMLLLATDRLWRGRARGDALLAGALGLSVAAAVTAGYYLRNLAVFGRLLVVNSQEDCFPFWEPTVTLPGFRTVSFYLGGDLRLLGDPGFPSQTPYFLGMEYASTWWDHLGFFGANPDHRLAPVLLVLGLGPTVLVCLGLWSVLTESAARREAWRPVVACFLVTLALHLASTLVVPLYNMVKPIYLFAAFAPGALLIGAGVDRMRNRHPGLEPWIRGGFAVLAAVVAVTFWYPG